MNTSLKEIVLKASADSLTDKDGKPVSLEFSPGLASEEIGSLQERLGGIIPDEVMELIRITSGVQIKPLGYLDFLGNYEFSFEEAFPIGFPILKDDSGNFWIVDIHPNTGMWGAVFFVCHDPPVIVIQAQTLANFLDQIIQSFSPPHMNLVSYVRDEAAGKIYASSTYFIELSEARQSPDTLLSTFANSLSHNFKLVDLRSMQIGSGVNYGLCGSTTIVKRFGAELIFAIESKRDAELLSRLLN